MQSHFAAMLPDLRPRTHRFAVDSIFFYRRLSKELDLRPLGLQYVRSATGINANYRAARRGRSRKEFIAKLGIVVEEADESLEWLEVFRDADIAHDPKLLAEARELLAIFTASLDTARRNNRKGQKKKPPHEAD